MPTGNELADGSDLKDDSNWDFDNGLRVLFFPMISASNMIEASPTYCRFKQLMRWYDAHYDFPIYWHILWPRDDVDETRYRYRWINEEEKEWLEDHDRVELIKMRFHATQSTDTGMCAREMREVFNLAEGDRYFDVIWNQKAGITPDLMDQIISRRGDDHVLPPIINTLQMFPMKEKSFSEWGQLKFAAGLVGPSTHTVWESDHEIMRSMNELRNYYRGEIIERFRDKSSVIEPGIDVDYIDDVVEDVEREDRPFIISHNGKIYNDRNYKESWEIMDTAYASPHDTEIQIVTPGLSGSAASAPGEYSSRATDQFEIYERLPKEEYLKQSARAHIMINSVKHTDFNQTMGEVVYAGALPVVRRGDWSELMFGEDYPFLYNGPVHGKKLLLHVLGNFDEYYEEYMPQLRERIRTRFNSARYFKEILEHFHRLREEVTYGEDWYNLPAYVDRYEEENRRKKAMLKSLKRCPDTFTMEDFRDQFKAITDNNSDILQVGDGRAAPPHLRYYWALKKYGVKDRCDDVKPVFEKGHLDKI